MPTIDLSHAETQLSRLVEALESGAEQAFVIARNGTPVARLLPIVPFPVGARIGGAKGKFMTSNPEPTLDAAVSGMFLGKLD